MKRFLILNILFSYAIAGCASKITRYPDVKIEDLAPAVAIAIPEKGRYLEQFEDCNSDNWICIDPPPQAVNYRILAQAYGVKLPQNLEVATTSHMGLMSFTYNEPEIILIGISDTDYVLPRYHHTGVVRIEERYAVPIYEGDELWWLPCSAKNLIKPAIFDKKDKNLGIPVDDVDENLKSSPYVELIGDKYFPTHGIFFEDITKYLAKNNPSMKDFDCEEFN